jgi:putative hydrolase of the HAD superfamily
MVLVFDLDDTLYEERTYVESGFRSVARSLETTFGWDRGQSHRILMEALKTEGRGHVFDRLLEQQGRLSKTLVRDCVQVYRNHQPDIQLWPAARKLLDGLNGHHLYLVTDGHKLVQARKVEALGIKRRFRKVYLTHRYGIQNSKPSTHCFELIRACEGCRWEEMVHVADNPAKDFVGLKPLGVETVRVLTGMYRDRVVRPEYDARYRIADLTELPHCLREIRV